MSKSKTDTAKPKPAPKIYKAQGFLRAGLARALKSHAMNYFTPELYLRFNLRDRAAAERSHDEWEAAVQSYRDHLRDIVRA